MTANRAGGNISLIDRRDGKLLGQIPIGMNPEFVRVRGHFAFVTYEPSAEGGPPPKPGSEAAKKEGQSTRKKTASRLRSRWSICIGAR